MYDQGTIAGLVIAWHTDEVSRDSSIAIRRTRHDAVFEGLSGINRHWGFDMPPSRPNHQSPGRHHRTSDAANTPRPARGRRRGLPAPFRAVRIVAVVLGLSLAGCAHTYVDDAGATHVFGLVSITIPPPIPPEAAGARAVRVVNVGLSMVRSDLFSSLSFGYNAEELVVVRNNACVDLRADGGHLFTSPTRERTQ